MAVDPGAGALSLAVVAAVEVFEAPLAAQTHPFSNGRTGGWNGRGEPPTRPASFTEAPTPVAGKGGFFP